LLLGSLGVVMGRRFDFLLGRTMKQTTQLKSLLGLAVARLGVLRGHRQELISLSRGTGTPPRRFASTLATPSRLP
jgi:hypothetical protein